MHKISETQKIGLAAAYVFWVAICVCLTLATLYVGFWLLVQLFFVFITVLPWLLAGYVLYVLIWSLRRKH